MIKLLFPILLAFPLYCSKHNVMPRRNRPIKETGEIRSINDLIRNLDSRIIKFGNNEIIIVRGTEDFLKSLKQVEDLYLKIAGKCPKGYGEQLALMRKIAEKKLADETVKPQTFCIIL